MRALGILVGVALGCQPPPPEVGHQLFTSPQVNPIAVVGEQLVVANTTSATVSVYRLPKRTGRSPFLMAEIPVGLDPVGVAPRPGTRQVWVTNHISDSITVLDLDLLDVVGTVQDLDPATGITTSDAPTGIVFAGPDRAFVSLDDRNEVLVIDVEEGVPAVSARLAIPAQAPRALAVAGGKLYVAAFESENQTEFPSCGPEDPRLARNGGAGLVEDDAWDEGCEFATEIIESANIDVLPDSPEDEDDAPQIGFDIDFGTIFDFAAVNPNIGGRIIVDRDRPDRDLFVFDVETLALEQVVEGVGTLLYGVAAAGDRVWVTNTEARNDLEGLEALGNRMFENRLAILDCPAGVCGAPRHVDLESPGANPFGVPVPTPYGIQASPDGSLLVASVAGSDGVPGTPGDPDLDIPGLVVLDAEGAVRGHVQTGAIPQGVALHTKAGAATAYVLNTVESSVSMVDLSDPGRPVVLRTFAVGSDPTPEEVKLGRIAFSSARASTSGTFSCESCHPNSNIDQLLWTINSIEGPNDVPDCDPLVDNCPEPRTTMPIRGLRDTLPLHWVGNLADPFTDLEGQLPQPESEGGPDCDLSLDGEVGCARDLVNASLSGVMCDPLPSCAVGPSGLPGAFGDEERDALAAFLMAVSYPPSPERRPDDRLSPLANQGVSDFFTDEDRLGVGSDVDGVGAAVGFAPVTCADNVGGCHALPLTANTNSTTVGGFDVPSMRGIWDRFILFSNGNISSEEWMRLAQECADGNPPGANPRITLNDSATINGLIVGDPCAIALPLLDDDGGGLPFPLPGGLAGFLDIDPFDGVPSGETVYDPAVGMTERGQFMGSFESIFALAYGVRGGPMWQFFSEMSVGLPGLLGRQLSLDASNQGDPGTAEQLALIEQYADEGRIRAVARNGLLGEYRFEEGRWRADRERRGMFSWLTWLLGFGSPSQAALSGAELHRLAAETQGVMTVTAHLRPGVRIGGEDRQILLDIDPDLRAAEMAREIRPVALPEPTTEGNQTIRIGALYADASARVLIDGELCGDCSLARGLAPQTGLPIADITIPAPLAEGLHVVQLLNPDGWTSNEMPILARLPEP